MNSFIPNLSRLQLSPHPRRDLKPNAPDGIYCLDNVDDVFPCESSVIIVRNALRITEEERLAIDAFMTNDERVPPTPNLYNRNAKPIGRKECTFGATYKFSGRQGTTIHGPVDLWPEAVQRALSLTRQLADQLSIDPAVYNGVHSNLYPHGKATVGIHQDNEGAMVKGMPIFSYTLLSDPSRPRPFSIYSRQTDSQRVEQIAERKLKNEDRVRRGMVPFKDVPEAKHPKIADVLLGHGDLIIMQGRMQEFFLHAIETAMPEARFADVRRINFTCRAFKEDVAATGAPAKVLRTA